MVGVWMLELYILSEFIFNVQLPMVEPLDVRHHQRDV